MHSGRTVRYHTVALLIRVGGFGALSITSCGTSAASSDPPLPSGWTWYQSSTGHFRIPVAPGWQVGGFYNGPLQFSNCEYSVITYPPGFTPTFSRVDTENDLRLLMITVVFPCNYGQQLSPHLFTNPLPGPVSIDGKRTTLYDISVQDSIGRLAVTTFGGHQYRFLLDSGPTSVAKGDLAIYMRILGDFQYTAN